MKKFIFKKKSIFTKKIYILKILFLILFLELSEREGNARFLKGNDIPKVSVFLPIYNKEKYLFRSIGSLQKQTIKNFEIIAINDCSTDNSLKILKKLSKKDHRIKIINNDRNHGLLYSRAKGIINSKGEFLMNLDPDDKLEGNNILKKLFNKAKKSNLEYIRFLIKGLPTNNQDLGMAKIYNKLQLEKIDYLITNKFIKRGILVKAYNDFYRYIDRYKWNFHEDNIWNLLVRKYSNKSKIIKKYIYIYKLNNFSLTNKRFSLLDIKNMIYKIKRIISTEEKNDLYYNYSICFNLYKYIIKICNISILKDKEIKNRLNDISFRFLRIYNESKEIKNSINNIMNIYSDKKILFFYSTDEKTLFVYLSYLTIIKALQKFHFSRIIIIDINNYTQINNIKNYIYSNDIILGFDYLIYNKNFSKIINKYYRNKIIILKYNFNFKTVKENKLLDYKVKILLLSTIKKNLKKIIELYFSHDYIFEFANHFNKKKKSKNPILSIISANFNYKKRIKAIIYKYFKNINYIDISSNFTNSINDSNISNVVKKSELVITDIDYIMELSILNFISCIFINKNDEIKKKLLFNLKYIYIIDDIKKLTKALAIIKNKSNNYNNKKFDEKINILKNLFSKLL